MALPSHWRFSTQYSVSKPKDFISPTSNRVGMCIYLFRTYVLCNDISIGVLFCFWHRLDRTKKMAGKMRSSFIRFSEWVSSCTFKLESEFALVASSYLAGTFPHIKQYFFETLLFVDWADVTWPCFDTPAWIQRKHGTTHDRTRGKVEQGSMLRKFSSWRAFVDNYKLHNAATRKSLR